MRVLRLGTGAAVRVFDGRGHEFDAVVASANRHAVVVEVGAPRTPQAPEPRVAITLAQAVLKGDHRDDVVRDAVMMGVAAIQPIVTVRTEVTLEALRRGRRPDRWARIAVSSAKQCGRATVPVVQEPRPLEGVTGALADVTLPGPALMFVEPSARAEALPLGDLDMARPLESTVLVGPEGGWTAEEIERASAACRLVTLGGRTLRADAMAIVALAALFTLWKEY
jgi:16S rRNA (uracil1498-N3)-methyltransferase